MQYVNRMRINLACQLLTDDDLSVTDICFKAGFKNPSNFNRQFLAVKGMAPSKFRRYQQLNDASRDASEEAAARGVGIDDAPAIVLVPGLPAQRRRCLSTDVVPSSGFPPKRFISPAFRHVSRCPTTA